MYTYNTGRRDKIKTQRVRSKANVGRTRRPLTSMGDPGNDVARDDAAATS